MDGITSNLIKLQSSLRVIVGNGKAEELCWKYKNNHGTVFVYCDISNGKMHLSSYLKVFADLIDDYESNYNYCPYCGKKLEIKERI